MLGYLCVWPPILTITLRVKSCYFHFTQMSPLLKEVMAEGHTTGRWNSQDLSSELTTPFFFHSSMLMLICIMWTCGTAIRNRKCTNLMWTSQSLNFKNWTPSIENRISKQLWNEDINSSIRTWWVMDYQWAASPRPMLDATWGQRQHWGSRPSRSWSMSYINRSWAGRRDILAVHLSFLGLTRDPHKTQESCTA